MFSFNPEKENDDSRTIPASTAAAVSVAMCGYIHECLHRITSVSECGTSCVICVSETFKDYTVTFKFAFK